MVARKLKYGKKKQKKSDEPNTESEKATTKKAEGLD